MAAEIGRGISGIDGVDAAAVAIELTCRGRGIIATVENWLRPFLDTRALRPVLPDWWVRYEGPQLYFPNRLMPVPLRAFMDLIAQERSSSTDTDCECCEVSVVP